MKTKIILTLLLFALPFGMLNAQSNAGKWIKISDDEVVAISYNFKNPTMKNIN